MPEDMTGDIPIPIGHMPCIDMPAGMPNCAIPAGGGTTVAIGMFDIPAGIDALCIAGGGTTMPAGGGGGGNTPGCTAGGGAGMPGGNADMPGGGTIIGEHGPTLV